MNIVCLDMVGVLVPGGALQLRDTALLRKGDPISGTRTPSISRHTIFMVDSPLCFPA